MVRRKRFKVEGHLKLPPLHRTLSAVHHHPISVDAGQNSELFSQAGSFVPTVHHGVN